MTWHTNPAVITLRKMARGLGLTRPLARLRGSRKYEQAFDEALFSTLQAGDVVWDVGANIGYYTRRFAQAVGPDGHVVAFEPFPTTAERLRAHMQAISNYTLQMTALGAEAGRVMMEAGEDAMATTSRIVADTGKGVTVWISTGDDLIRREDIPVPTVLKIDTEGFELDVLRGMTDLLSKPQLRAIFVEVHFGLLSERGQPKAPADIERLLRVAGFTTRWVDPSHIAAERT
jgi:FkbM family methyltransferase